MLPRQSDLISRDDFCFLTYRLLCLDASAKLYVFSTQRLYLVDYDIGRRISTCIAGQGRTRLHKQVVFYHPTPTGIVHLVRKIKRVLFLRDLKIDGREPSLCARAHRVTNQDRAPSDWPAFRPIISHPQRYAVVCSVPLRP